jgi:hypothetical protein
LDEISEVFVLDRPQHHVPVIWHDSVGEDFDRNQPRRFDDDAQEGFVIWILVEDPRSRIARLSTWKITPAGATRTVRGIAQT